MAKRETILVLGAHSDDFVIGCGGTIAKYAEEGKKVISVVFSYGENSHPWLKHKVIQKMRKAEAEEAGKVLNCEIIIFDLLEFKFMGEYPRIEEKLLKIINKEKPSKIFTHSNEDPHPDHKAVNTITLKLCDKSGYKPEIYIYSVWNPVSFKTQFPALYIDITSTFKLKLRALKKFESQLTRIIYPITLLFYRALKDGFHIRKRFAEHFFRIR